MAKNGPEIWSVVEHVHVLTLLCEAWEAYIFWIVIVNSKMFCEIPGLIFLRFPTSYIKECQESNNGDFFVTLYRI